MTWDLYTTQAHSVTATAHLELVSDVLFISLLMLQETEKHHTSSTAAYDPHLCLKTED